MTSIRLLSTSALAACLAFLPMHVATAQQLPARIVEAGKVSIAVNAGFPPMEMRNPENNELIGFDIDLANAIAKVLGIETEWVDGAFEQMIPALVSNRVDLIFSGMSDLPERRETVDFVNYLKSGSQVYSLSDSAINTVEDMCGQPVTTSLGTSLPDELKAWSDENCVAQGKEPVEIVLDNNLGQQIINLKQGRALAALQAVESIALIIEQEKGGIRAVGEPIVFLVQGIAFRKDDTQLRDAFLYGLREVIKSGEYAALLDKWNLTSAAYATPTINMEAVP